MVRAVAAAVLLAFAVAPAPAASAASKAPVSKDAGPLEVTRAFYAALHAGDAARAASLSAGDARPTLEAFVRLSRAHRDLEAAVAKRFGTQEAGRVGYGNRVQAEVKSLLGAEEEIEGDAARVATLDGRELASLVRVNGAWKVELDGAFTAPGGADGVAKSAAASEAEGKRVVAAIRAGKYPTAEAAVRDFHARVARATGRAPPKKEPEQEEEGVPL